METTRSLALLSMLLLVPLVLSGDLVDTDQTNDVPDCDVKENNMTLVSDNGRLIRCLDCKNVAASEDHSTDEVCKCPEWSMCYAREEVENSNVFEYFCTTPLDLSSMNSGLYLEDEQ
ncbi:uncharacterized protein LOC117331703 [Pecten maximus]|uniref:uncharacterized protein LOC117331703 n=1 Tax=Pecten maximus TaxID=6579 RepID=UPI00145814EA|nr:uncharacterized protein LOC117331703 [Pecten maximus]